MLPILLNEKVDPDKSLAESLLEFARPTNL